MIDIVDRLRFDATRCEVQFSKGVAGNINEAVDEIERLRAALTAVSAMDAHGFYVAPMGSALRRQVEAALAPKART